MFTSAKVADVLRSNQRDEEFVEGLQENVAAILKTQGFKTYSKYKKFVPFFTNFWYYYLTSASNLQTLGEEYAGILRVVDHNNITSTYLQLLWLGLYIGGEPLFKKLLHKSKLKISSSKSLTTNAKTKLTKFLNFMEENNSCILKLHHSIFYINGVFYNVSNRFTGIKYVLVRQWLDNNSSTKSFEILGKLSLFYLAIHFTEQFFKMDDKLEFHTQTNNKKKSAAICLLCMEQCTDASATPCGHLFCWKCIFDALREDSRCPVCRDNVNPSRIVLLQNFG